MARGRRLAFVRRWYERALQADEPYDRFFFAWIATVAAAQRRRTESGIPFREIYADREKVIEYFEINRSTVAGVLSQHKESLKRIASRKGHRYGQPVMDTRSLRLRRIFSDFAAHYTQGMPLGEEALLEATAEVINKIRITLFQDLDEDRKDIESLELVNPILLEILRQCEFP